MFQFGLFSTFIPYLLLTIAYLSFIGNIALNKNQYLDFEGLPTQYEISKIDHFSCVSFQHSAEKDWYNYVNHFFAYQQKNVEHHTKHLDKPSNYLVKCNITNEFVNTSLFTRPPPVA